ncbi:MAG: discoidin domain-containing protein [Planctomycetes bacterium]|nr:discoidin domain-containing protein [Planctomycetota bacterium]
MYRKPLVLLCIAGLCLTAGVAGAAPLTVKVNFQSNSQGDRSIPAGYLPDYGLAFGDRGNGFSYGWSRDISADARDRNSAIAPRGDQRYDTLLHLQKGANAIWEIVIPNAQYNVLMVCGDPDNTDQTNTLDVENVICTDPNGQTGNYDKYNVLVAVADGRLTIKPAPGASNSKICFVDIVMAVLPTNAQEPVPADKATDVPKDVVLGWTAGDFAQKHNVYLGTDVADVNNPAATNTLVSQGQTATTYDPVSDLDYGKTYYWRVDEVNAPPDATVFKGDVWSFTVEPYAYPIQKVTATASSAQPNMGPEKAVNGSGLNKLDQHSTTPEDMWLSLGTKPNWIQFEFDQPYNLHQVWVWNSNQMIETFIGFGAKNVKIEVSLDGAAWSNVPNVPEFGRGTGLPTYAANTTVNLGGVAAKYVKFTVENSWGVAAPCGLSEVRFFYVPVQARSPQPANAATGVGLDVTPNWRPGRKAVSHKVYFGTDQQAVTGGTAPAQTVTDHSFAPASLAFGTTYYWRVDEVNDAQSWAGPVWSFTTVEYALVEDFESYTDDEGRRIYETWADGFGSSNNGSQVGYAQAPFAETKIVHGGKQSMPLNYNNAGAITFSEAIRTFDKTQNWTANGIKSLSLWFQGTAGNGGQLYVKINNTKVPYPGNAADIAKLAWVPWNIDLSSAGNVSNVTKLTIGVEGAGAKGLVFIDDIRLYPKAAAFFTPADPGKTNLKALYAFEGNANDTSGNNFNGTLKQAQLVALKQAQLVASGRPNGGSAVKVEKVGYVDLGNPPALDFSTTDWSVTAWYKNAMTGTGDANKGTIYGKGGDTAGGKRYCLILSETAEGVVTLVTDDDVTKYVLDSKSKTNNDEWHFVAGQREGTTLRIYIDGQLENSMTIPAAYNLSGTSQHNAYVGAITDHTNNVLYKLYNGLIDDVRVYNKALSQEEVLWLAGNTAPVAKPF